MVKPSYTPAKKHFARIRRNGHDIYEGGATPREAKKAAEAEFDRRMKEGRGYALGPSRTILARALQAYGMHCLPFLKGAPQEARRINKYLRDAGIESLVLREVEDGKSTGAFFAVSRQEHTAERAIPKGLKSHRRALLTKTASSDKHREILATKVVAEITRLDMQRFVDSLRKEDCAAATIALERALLRRFFNFARKTWNWPGLLDNPATGLNLPAIQNERTRVMSLEEEERLAAVMEECKNEVMPHAFVLLRETAMRAGEALKTACWGDIVWERSILQLRKGKTGKRDVPLSPAAIETLKAMPRGEPNERILSLSYEAMRAAWRRACERAGVKNLRIHDLRHTAATRMAIRTGGNIYLVKALTGHQEDRSAQRYINVKADDVVRIFQTPVAPAAAPVAPVPAAEAVVAPAPAVVVDAPLVASVTGGTVTLTKEQLDALIMQSVQAGLAAQASRADAPAGRSDGGDECGNVRPLRRAA